MLDDRRCHGISTDFPWKSGPMEFSRPEYWSGLPFPSSGDHPNPGIESRSPPLQVDSLPAEPQGKPNNTEVGSLSLLQWIFWPRNRTKVSCIAGGFFTNWAIREVYLNEELKCTLDRAYIKCLICSNFLLRIPWALPLLCVFLAGGRRVGKTETDCFYSSLFLVTAVTGPSLRVLLFKTSMHLPTSSQQPTSFLLLKCTRRSFPYEECIANNSEE